jgi:diadenosine tetraphosphate (Ap4A) HIT family hydrolase
MPAEQWARLKAGVDCPMCADMHLEVNAFSYLVAELERSYVRLVRNQYRRGWTILALKRHATELFELAEDEHAEFWREVACAARALNDLCRPVKTNYSVLGNLGPHSPLPPGPAVQR